MKNNTVMKAEKQRKEMVHALITRDRSVKPKLYKVVDPKKGITLAKRVTMEQAVERYSVALKAYRMEPEHV